MGFVWLLMGTGWIGRWIEVRGALSVGGYCGVPGCLPVGHFVPENGLGIQMDTQMGIQV